MTKLQVACFMTAVVVNLIIGVPRFNFSARPVETTYFEWVWLIVTAASCIGLLVVVLDEFFLEQP